MTVQELAEMAGRRINTGCKTLQLILPPEKSNRQFAHLNGRRSPRGRVLGLNTKADGTIVVFEAIDVLSYCIANGADVTILDSAGRKVVL